MKERLFRIGLLFSTTGTTSIVEEGQLQACLLAIDEVNQRGKFRFKALIEDICSNPQVAAEKAHKLMTRDQADLLVGCWTSACRKAVLPVLEETGALLLYPTNYEGQEAHPQVFYLGAVPNQQVESTLSWVVGNLASRFVLLGSDYIYPRSANQQVRQWVERIDPGMIVYERYFPLGWSDFHHCLEELRPLLGDQTPTVIFSNLVGSSVADFYRQYQQAGLRSSIISPITSEREIAVMGVGAAAGHYCTSGYFQSLDNAENHHFVGNYCSRFGETTVNGSMELAWNAIRLLEMALDDALLQGPDFKMRTARLRQRLQHLSIEAPQGKLIVDPKNQHLWLWSRIGRVRESGTIEIVWSSSGPIPPRPFSEPATQDSQAATLGSLPDEFEDFPVANARFAEKIRIARITSKTRSNVLISGEPGCGKMRFARAIHRSGILANRPLLIQNCSGISFERLRDELFGTADGPGRLELANGGTLLLDEVGELPLELQRQLLTSIREGRFRRAGEAQARPLEIRILALTARDLPQEIAYNGTFLSELYSHLSVFHIQIPPLRDRAEDIPLLAAHFLEQLNRKNGQSKVFSPEILSALSGFSWPGNVLQLTTVVERAFYLSQQEKTLSRGQLPPFLSPGLPLAEPHPVEGDCATQGEKAALEKVIRETGYNMSLAARTLGVSRSTLYRRIQKLGIALKMDLLST